MTLQSIGSGITGTRSRATIATVLAALALALIAVLMSAGPTLADPPDTLIDPPDHRHFIVLPDGGRVPVGPQICGNPEMQQAFNEFHYNIHHSGDPVHGNVPTLGPQDGAPGLHNDRGAELIGVPGCG
jgi:hypothetical protein